MRNGRPVGLWPSRRRGAQEKTIAELKGEFALDVVPTHHYRWRLAAFSSLPHHLPRSFQVAPIATPRRRSRKRTYAHVVRSMRTLRFLLIIRAGQLPRIGPQRPSPRSESGDRSPLL